MNWFGVGPHKSQTERSEGAAAPPWAIMAAFAIPLLITFFRPRAAAAMIVVLALILLSGNILRRDAPSTWLSLPSWFAMILTLAAYATLSAFWAEASGQVLFKTSIFILLLLCFGIAVTAVSQLESVEANHWSAIGILLAVGLAVIILGFEAATKQLIARSLIEAFPSLRNEEPVHFRMAGEQVVWVSDTTINRRMTILTLVFWPALMIIWQLSAANDRRRNVILSAAACALVVLLSDHQSSQLGLVLGVLVFAAVFLTPKIGFRALTAMWCMAFLLALPLAKVPYAAGLHQAPWLFESARQRVIIWNYVATRTLERPIFGIGADATHFAADPADDSWVAKTPLRTIDPRDARHPHNGFLQIWYELGAIGVAFFMVWGVVALRAIEKHLVMGRAAFHRAAAAGLFATGMAVSASSYSIWQSWYQAGLMIAALAALTAIAIQRNAEYEPPENTSNTPDERLRSDAGRT